MECENLTTKHLLTVLLSYASDAETGKCGAGNERLTAEYQNDKLEFIKNLVIAEFLGLASNTDFTESDFGQYNYILKCFVLIDLKTQKITH